MKRLSLMAAALSASLLCTVPLLPVSAAEIPTYAPLPPAPADAAALPTVVILSMGGTIASRGTPRLNVANYGGKGVPHCMNQVRSEERPVGKECRSRWST